MTVFHCAFESVRSRWLQVIRLKNVAVIILIAMLPQRFLGGEWGSLASSFVSNKRLLFLSDSVDRLGIEHWCDNYPNRKKVTIIAYVYHI
jgi:hypothetical protein